jgi:DNA processing protein
MDPRTIAAETAEFPRRLRDLHGDGAAQRPLHVRGTLAEPTLAVAIVGARAATPSAVAVAERLAFELAAGGATVISGGAVGIDGAAHRGAVAAPRGPHVATVAVLGCGVDVVYPPRHARLFDQIVDGGGALVSMFPAGTLPRRGTFIARNAVIAALSDVVIVVEAGAASGSLHTARAAIRLGRGVGAIGESPGARRLHAAGAAVIDTAADVVALAAGRARRAAPLPVDDRARTVARALGDGAGVEQLALRTGLAPRAIACALVDLEVAGWVIARAGGRYVPTAIAQEC